MISCHEGGGAELENDSSKMPTAVSVAKDLTTSTNVGPSTRGVENDRRKGGRGTVKVSGKGKGLTGTLKKKAGTTVVDRNTPPELLIAADYADAAVSAVASEDGNLPPELLIAAASAASSAVASEDDNPPAAVLGATATALVTSEDAGDSAAAQPKA